MSYTLQLLGSSGVSERSLTDWGIDADSAVLELNSFEADTFSFAMASPDALEEDGVFTYGATIRLRQNGVSVFVGTIRDLPIFGSSDAERQKITAYNFWHSLEAWIYQRSRRIMNEDFSVLELVATTQIILGRDPATGAKITNLQEIQNICAFAGLSLTAAFTGVTPPFEEATDLPLATAIRRMVAWQPDLLGRTSYVSGAPLFIISDPAHASPIAFDLTAGAPMISIEGRVRRDLVPQGVSIRFVTSEVDPATELRYARVTTDIGGVPTNGPFTMISTMTIGDGETAPIGLAASYYASLSVPFIEGSMSLRSREADLSWVPGDVLNLSNAPASWAGARVALTSVLHQLGSGVSTLNFGPPQFLPFASFAALNARAKDSRPPDGKAPEGPGDGSDGDAGGTHDTGRTGTGGSGGAPASAPITHCVEGVQQTTRVLKA